MINKDIDLLTPREIECGKWLLIGKTAEETATILGLSKRTVEAHLASMKIKLSCSNKVLLAVKLAAFIEHPLET